MQKPRLSFILLVLLIASNFLWGFFYFSQRRELVEKRQATVVQATNVQVLDFTRLFINDVLKSKGEVDFEKRLELENAVRSIKNPEILAQWGKFINSKDEVSAQAEVKNLLGTLIDKIKTK